MPEKPEIILYFIVFILYFIDLYRITVDALRCFLKVTTGNRKKQEHHQPVCSPPETLFGRNEDHLPTAGPTASHSYPALPTRDTPHYLMEVPRITEAWYYALRWKV